MPLLSGLPCFRSKPIRKQIRIYGVAALPSGRRRDAYDAVVAAIFAEDAAGRVLPFDGSAGEQHARIVSTRRASGRPIEGFDALMAATATAAGFAVATRDLGGFEGCDLAVIDLWQAAVSAPGATS